VSAGRPSALFFLDIYPKGAHGPGSLGAFRASAVTPELRGFMRLSL